MIGQELEKPVALDGERKELLHVIVDQINTVLYTIVPRRSIHFVGQ